MNTKRHSAIKKGSRSTLKKLIKPLLVCLLLLVPTSEAHEGPPFPIIVDRQLGPYLVSVWTDPDIGTGTLFVVFELKEGEEMEEITSVKFGVAPSSGRLKETIYDAVTQRARNGTRYYADVEFDRGEKFTIRTLIEGEGWSDEYISQVIATPDGSVGPLTVVIYALPFLGIGILWVRAIIRKRQIEQDMS